MRGWRWRIHRMRGALRYRIRLGLLVVFGPATLDWEHDPVEQLKRARQAELLQDATVWVAPRP